MSVVGLGDPRSQERPGRNQTLIGLGLALAIVAAAWGVGERIGLDAIGQGGLNARHMPKAGEIAPELLMVDAEGQPVLLSQFRGQAVWINFWASWCDPCKAEFPELDIAYRRLAPEGLAFIALNFNENPAQATEFASRYGATFPLTYSNTQLAGDEWDLRNYPTHLYIDAQGVVQAVIAAPLDAATMVARGEALIAGQPIFGATGG